MSPEDSIVVDVRYPTTYNPLLDELNEIGKHLLQVWPRETHSITFDIATTPDRGITFRIARRSTYAQ